MKKNFTIIFLVSVIWCSAQTQTPKLPIDSSSQKITYSGVVDIAGVNKDALYSNAHTWLVKTFVSSKSVLQMDDKDGGSIIGKANTSIRYTQKYKLPFEEQVSKTQYPDGIIEFVITIKIKDGKYRYEITDFYHSDSKYFTNGECEKMINTTDKAFGVSLQDYYNYELWQLDNSMKKIITGLKEAMSKKDSW